VASDVADKHVDERSLVVEELTIELLRFLVDGLQHQSTGSRIHVVVRRLGFAALVAPHRRRRLAVAGDRAGVLAASTGDVGRRLQIADTSYTNADGLASALGSSRKRTVDGILDNANRPMTPLCEIESGEALYPLASEGTGEYGFCWSMTDPDSTEWIPQGITTTGDAFTARSYASREAVVITWHNDTETSTRISIAPAGGYSPSSNYRHLLLVTPQSGATFSAVDCHAGGAMWYGDLLYVACTDSIKIFDWRYVYSADYDSFCNNKVGKFLDGTVYRYCADLGAYFMMQVGQITSPSGNVWFSSISFDRASTPDKLVVSEYSTSADGKLLRFNLDYMTRLPSNTSAADVYDMPFTQVQGATTRGPEFWFHSSGGVIQSGETPADRYGTLRSWSSSTRRFVSYPSAYGAEAISFWPGSLSTPEMPDMLDALYTLTEHAGHRAVIAIRRAAFE
jgi:hypothetical protein